MHRAATSVRRRRAESGVSILMVGLGATVLIGAVGLSIDMGRLFVVRSELQSFADAAAMAGVLRLDGTRTGVALADAAAQTGPTGTGGANGYLFETTPMTQVATSYAQNYGGNFEPLAMASSASTNSYRFLKVQVQADVSLYFLRVIPGIPTSQGLAATATAGQQPQTATFSSGGLIPFSPDAHNAADTMNFGLIPNQRYTLKWGNKNVTTCGGDIGFTPGNAPSEHGFVDIGQGNGTANLRSSIGYGGYPNPSSNPSEIVVGDTLLVVPGNRGATIFNALADRSRQDPDQSSVTWEDYKANGTGNGRRVVTAIINDPTRAAGNGANNTVLVIGYGNFLLDRASDITGSAGPICATYIGPATTAGGGTGGTDGTKVYRPMLYE